MRYLIIILLVFLLLPLLRTGSVGGKLVGHTPPSASAWTLAGWFSGDWQAESAAYLRESFGFRNDLVRTNNLKNYQFFGEITALDVVEGKSGYFYEESYLQAAMGTTAASERTFEQLGRELSFVRDSLEANGVDFLILMAPGKGSYFPEYAPEPYASLPPNPADELSLLSTLRQRQIDHLNFNQWFREMKDTVSYPLFPQQGIHWSTYGQLIAMDSLIKYFREELDIDMPEIVIDSVEVSEEQRGIEADIYRGMNLPTEPSGYPLAYPEWHVEGPEKQQPKVLFIGDSFYWELYVHLGMSQKFFGNGDFYYYFSRIMRNGADVGDVNSLDLPEELFQYDAVVILETEPHYHRLGNGFLSATVDKWLRARLGPVTEEVVHAKAAEFRADPGSLQHVANRAAGLGNTTEEQLLLDATWTTNQERMKDFLARHYASGPASKS